MVHQQILVKGKVQGVYFRATAKSVADSMEIRGTVRNTPDGHVEIMAEGAEAAMNAFIDWCRSGPPAAQVSELEIREAPVQHFIDFKILRG